MNNQGFSKNLLTTAFLNFIPSTIKDDLLENSNFLKEFDIATDRFLSIGKEGILFYRSTFMNAIRVIYREKRKTEILDSNNQKWEVEYYIKENSRPQIRLFDEKHTFYLSDFDVLSFDKILRLTTFDEYCKKYNLYGLSIDKLHQSLLVRPFTDDEYDSFESEIQNSPIHRAHMISVEFLEGKVQISTLVPNSRNYYDRLVGSFDGSNSIQDYCSKNIPNIFKQNFNWKPFDGFLYSLILTSHTSSTNFLSFDSISSVDLINLLDFIRIKGDRVSQTGLIELGLNELKIHPEIEPVLIELINQVQEKNINNDESSFNILSNLVVFVDGELSRLQLFSDTKPYYRRLASFAQAALIFQQICNSSIDYPSFSKWAYDNRAINFYMQSFTDMRLEPRWTPDFISGEQLKSYCVGRILNAGQKNKEYIKQGPLFEIINKVEQESIKSIDKGFSYYLPGPLDGGEPPQFVIPSEIELEIESLLKKSEVDYFSFIPLVNLALLCQIDFSYVELATNALKIGNHRLSKISDKTQLIQVLTGLAMVAGVTRSEILGDELQIIARVYRNDSQYPLTLDEEMKLCLVAASSRKDIDLWTDFVGNWITELAFEKNNYIDVQTLYSHLLCLCNIVPKLWVSCGRADAALKAYIGCLQNV